MRAVFSRFATAAAGISILAACTGGQQAIQPPSTAVNVQAQSTLQFRVGTVNFRAGAATFFNTVVTFRQPNGLSATLYSVPTITGPAGFTVPSTVPPSCQGTTVSTTISSPAPGIDAGTNMISATQPTQPGTPAVVTTFAQAGGAFAYGFAPANSTTSGIALYPGNPGGRAFPSAIGTYTDIYTQPIYCASSRRYPFVLGPPAVPDFHPASAGFPPGFIGYDSGFVMFGVTPVAGTYAFHLTVPGPDIGSNAAVFDQNATLATTVPMGNVAPVVVAQPGGAGTSGLTFTVAPAPPTATAQVLYVVNQSSGTFWSYNAGTTGGVFSLPNAGAAGDVIRAYVVAANWDIIGDAPPNNTSPAPALPAQTDISVSVLTSVAL